MRSRRNALRLIVVAALAAVLLAGCGNDDNDSSTATTKSKGSITIAGSDFLEQDIVANIYGAALRAKGYSVTVRPHLGARITVQPALVKGDVDLLAEYVGSFVDYLKGTPTGDLAATVAQLRQLISKDGLIALEPASAYDANALVVTKATADKYKLTNTSDLKPVAAQLKLGGPPECPDRPRCLKGYEDPAYYGLKFKSFESLGEISGPIEKNALKDGKIDVAVMLSSDVPENSVVLKDDKGLQPAENIIPVIRTDKATDEVKQILNAVSAKLTLEELVELNIKAGGADKPDPADLAKDWVKEYGLA